MKKVFAFFLLVFLLAPPLLGQTFFEKDTKYVVWRTPGVEAPGYHTFQEVYLDSIKSGTEYYHVLIWEGYKSKSQYYKVKDNKVYVISNTFKNKAKEYHLLYDFNLNKGDSLFIDTMNPKQVLKYLVDSVSTILINGKSKKVQFMTVKYTYKSLTLLENKFTFIESIGCLETGLVFYESLQYIDWQEWECLRICMNDSAYLPKLNDSTLQFLETPCMSDSMREKISIKELNNPEKVLIYPNPVTDVLIIENFKGKIQLYNLSGSLIMEEMIEPKKTLNIRSLPKGIYYLKLSNDRGSKVKRVLKQ